MTVDWMHEEITPATVGMVVDRAAAYAPREQELERFWTDSSVRRIQYFIAVLEDPRSPCQQRQGWLPRIDPPITRQAYFEDIGLNLRLQFTLLERRMGAGLDDAWTPSLWPLFGNNHCTGAFGCEAKFPEPMQYPWTRPVLEAPSEVYAWAPDLQKSCVAQRILEATSRWRTLTGGRMPLRVPELFGPETAASQVLGSVKALEMVMTHPAAAPGDDQGGSDDHLAEGGGHGRGAQSGGAGPQARAVTGGIYLGPHR
ncbi:MAG: hypothetical protein QF541_14700 [Lentisphaeria bacterium]|nr:hypothetical protein [Lentisphaeria bacterium]